MPEEQGLARKSVVHSTRALAPAYIFLSTRCTVGAEKDLCTLARNVEALMKKFGEQ
jgi:hypothetical protein